MKHLFVPFILAKKLKESGFNEPCIAGYDEYTEEGEEIELKSIVNEFGILSGIVPNQLAYTISAPTFQQVTDWLREKHNLHAEVNFVWIDQPMYLPQIVYDSVTVEMESESDYYSAMNKAILKALEYKTL